MCTVTFVPRTDGFFLAMNRDDAYSRAQTNPPEVHTIGSSRALFPYETKGGTWIAANQSGLAFCLLNWNRPASGPKTRSRGEIIPVIAHAASLEQVSGLLNSFSSEGLDPFRLIAFSLPDHAIREWRVHTTLEAIDFPWEYRHWFSSGVGDDEAAKRRQKICAEALTQPDVLSSNWVRRLHQSHGSEPGPFSICVHRETGGTLSYTEVETSAREVTMRYSPASPCTNQPMTSLRLPLRQASSSHS
jgi:hypothetical protein